MKIVADDKIPFLRGVLEPYAEVVYLPGVKIGREDVKDADALITRTRTRVNGDLLEGTKVKFVATATIGYDHIDTKYLEERGIRWTNAPGCNSGSVMQYIAAALSRLSADKGFRFQGSTLGVIGVGHVGSKVARMAGILGMKVLLNDPPRQRKEGPEQFVPLEELLEASDVVTLHVPLNKTGEDRTLGMADDQFLNRMNRGSILINSSRGPVVLDKALKEALGRGMLGGAVLDVWNHEPAIDPELMEQVDIATPHIAGYSADGKANGTSMSVQAVARFLGLPLTDWYPAEVPAPSEPVITLHPEERDREEILRRVILHTYPIDRDDKNLREHPEKFEQLRGDYPLRREFGSYSIRMKRKDPELEEKLKQLNFKMINN
jgi:erythronate-4-phosphate dehydrogenase